MRPIMATRSCLQSLSHGRLFVTLWSASHQVSLSFTIFQSLLRFMFSESVMFMFYISHFGIFYCMSEHIKCSENSSENNNKACLLWANPALAQLHWVDCSLACPSPRIPKTWWVYRREGMIPYEGVFWGPGREEKFFLEVEGYLSTLAEVQFRRNHGEEVSPWLT